MSEHVFPRREEYPSEFYGMYGEFGSGANVKARYLQIVLRPGEINDIDIISDIEGSEKWPVPDLFQRLVSKERVNDEIVPYLKNKELVKFFNPISLIALPIDDDNNVIKAMPNLKEEKLDNEDIRMEYTNHFKLETKQKKYYATFKWNKLKTRIVAIDGQHRLTAMKKILDGPGDADIKKWTIPAVLIVMTKDENEKESSNILEVARKTFVYMNSKADPISPNRKILLDDESPNNIFTQAFLQLMHENDCKLLEERDKKMPPLLMINWREGLPSSIFEITEIRDCIEHYLLGEDFGEYQKEEIAPSEFLPPIPYNDEHKLSSADAKKIREKFQEEILPGIMKFFQGIKPYSDYISEIYELEQKRINKDAEISKHAFNKLRFGQSNNKTMAKEIDEWYEDIVADVAQKKHKLPNMLKRDIGTRALFFAFGALKEHIVKYELSQGRKRISWLEIADLLLPSFNEIISEGWFNVDPSYDATAGKREFRKNHYNLLELIAFDANGKIINYRLEDAEKGLGVFILMLVAKKLLEKNIIDYTLISHLWDGDIGYKSNIEKGVERESKKLWRAKLKSNFDGTIDELNKVINKEAKRHTNAKIRKLENEFGINRNKSTQ